MIADWKTVFPRLAINDALGVDWMDDPHFPHFCGNFWMARADWLASLEDHSTYKRSRPGFHWAGHPWERMNCELWLGSQPWHQIESLCCRNAPLWGGDFPFTIDTHIEGFKR